MTDYIALARECGAEFYMPPPLLTVRRLIFTYDQLAAFAARIAQAAPADEPRNRSLLQAALDLSKYAAAPFFGGTVRIGSGDDAQRVPRTTTEWWAGLEEQIEAIQPRLSAALSVAPAQPTVAISKRDADYWLESRAAIIAALDEAGFLLTSDARGFKVVKAPGAAPSQDREDARLLALERITHSYRLLLAGRPVRDVAETLAEADAAIAARQAPKEPT